MSLKRDVSLATALRYRGQGPMLAFILHRIGGLSMVLFVGMHMAASFFGGKTGVFLNSIYESWLFQAFLYFGALFHVINGLRITLFDLWPKLIEYEREALWLEWAIFLPVYLLSVFVMLQTGLGG